MLTQIKSILELYDLDLSTPFNKIPEEALELIYNGCHQDIVKDLKHAGISKKIKINFEGLIPFLEQVVEDKESYEATLIERHFTTDEVCPDCHGARLQPSSLQFKIDGKNISEVSALSLSNFRNGWKK